MDKKAHYWLTGALLGLGLTLSAWCFWRTAPVETTLKAYETNLYVVIGLPGLMTEREPDMKIGVTGHQELENSAWVKDELLRVLRQQVPPLIGITSLAIGADQLFAQAILECGGTLQVIIPFEGYADTFDEHGRAEYQRFLSVASVTEVLPKARFNEEAYLSAGKWVVDLSDLLVAVWDGKPAAGRGGTADIVEYARQQRKNYVHINPDTQKTL